MVLVKHSPLTVTLGGTTRCLVSQQQPRACHAQPAQRAQTLALALSPSPAGLYLFGVFSLCENHGPYCIGLSSICQTMKVSDSAACPELSVES